ncbi:MAG: Epimerase family protein [Candidatus Erwinia impunctatus]|nr:Epimerase family protein [Culicoides impunctatus]
MTDMQILITGGTGLVGRSLIPLLCDRGAQITVLTRNLARARQQFHDKIIQFCSDLRQFSCLDKFDAVINLAGEPIASHRWSDKHKKLICQSRWDITEQLTILIQGSSSPPAIFISASASGFYGDSGDQLLTESSAAHDEFTHQLCLRWEKLASRAESAITRVCLLRTGVVLSNDGGAFPALRKATTFYAGSKIGDGQQFFPWIHIDDMTNAILWLLETPGCHGPYNLVAPTSIQQADMAKQLGEILHRPTLLRIPAGLLSLLMGESAVLLLASQRMVPERLLHSGFEFSWPTLTEALHDLLNA